MSDQPFCGPDPQPYDGPLRDITGMKPYNRYLWPTESWQANYEPGWDKLPSVFEMSIVHLADGRFSTSGSVSDIENGTCVFSSRYEAVTSEMARMIRMVTSDASSLTPNQKGFIINWSQRIEDEVKEEQFPGWRIPKQQDRYLPPAALKFTLVKLMEGAA